MNRTKMAPAQDPDKFLYIVDNCRDRLDTSSPPERPTDRQCKDGHSTASVVTRLRKFSYLQRRHFGLADIRGMMATIYVDNLSCRSITSAGIVGPGATIKAMDRDLSDAQCHSCLMFGF